MILSWVLFAYLSIFLTVVTWCIPEETISLILLATGGASLVFPLSKIKRKNMRIHSGGLPSKLSWRKQQERNSISLQTLDSESRKFCTNLSPTHIWAVDENCPKRIAGTAETWYLLQNKHSLDNCKSTCKWLNFLTYHMVLKMWTEGERNLPKSIDRWS